MRPLRYRRRGENAQAVIEMALVLPITLALMTGYVALMIINTTQAQLRAATTLAAQSALTAPVDDFNESCNWASDAFAQTLYGPNAGLADPVNASACNQAPHYSGPVSCCGIQPAAIPWNRNATISCSDPGYFSGGLAGGSSRNDPVTCTATMTLDFSRTPVDWAFPFLKPTLTQETTAYPPAAGVNGLRQCNPSDIITSGTGQQCT